jgi:hypothetical protein
MFRLLGMPVNTQKLVVAVLKAIFLGIEIDTEEMTLGTMMASERLSVLEEIIDEWLTDEPKTVQDLRSLAGSLIFASTVIKPGRLFVQRMFATLRMMDHRELWAVPKSDELRRDLSWWKSFLPYFNHSRLGRCKIPTDESMSFLFEVWTDASDFGGGAVSY